MNQRDLGVNSGFRFGRCTVGAAPLLVQETLKPRRLQRLNAPIISDACGMPEGMP